MADVIHVDNIQLFIQKLRPRLMESFRGCRLIALKIHFGEPGNKFAFRPDQIKPVTDLLNEMGLQFFLYDSPVAYGGPRGETASHQAAAIAKGWGELGDIRTNDDHFTRTGKYLTYQVCRELAEADGVLVVSHFKGHVCSGFGGAIKNLGMGALTKSSKSAIHEGGKPYLDGECSQCGTCQDSCPIGGIRLEEVPVFETCFGCSECIKVCPEEVLKVNLAYFDDLLADGATVAASTFKHVYYINYLVNMAESCDCDPGAKAIIAPDAGYLGSIDPVTIDQASYDIVTAKAGRDVFLKHNKKSGTEQVAAAQDFGMGSAVYKLERG